VTSHAPISQRVAQLMSQMALADEISMVEGHGTTNPYVFYTPAIPALCIPAVGLEDGPAGVADGLTGATQPPAGVALAATWDPSLAEQYGQVIGAEEFGKGASANLGPTVNIDRDPRWGRSFEAMSEDPFLNASLDVPEIQGVQGQGVESQVKHLAVYNQETFRNSPADSVIIDPRTEQEIYLPAFHAAVTSGDASVMCSYAVINANFACNDSELETTILRDEWGFQGFVMSDYGALHSTQGAVEGTDQEQPFNTYYGTALQTDVQNGTIPKSVLNTMVQRVLTVMFQYKLFSQPRTGSTSATVTTPGHVALTTQVAESGTTLLKNAGPVLPLSSSGSIAVVGPAAEVVVSDDTESEATDRLSLNLPSAQDELISAVAAANPHTVVVIDAGAPVAMPWLSSVAGVVDAWYPGQTSGTSLASALFGQTDPGGHLPVTFPSSLSQVPASTTAQFPGNGTTVQYSEGIDVGYRWYDAKDMAPLFPFGFGLSYTQFAFSGLSVSRAPTDGTQDVRVSATVTNVGHRSGSEVAQLYLGDPSSTGEPPRELGGFQRVSLAPGRSARVSFVVTPQQEAWWSDSANGWTQTAGAYRVYVGDSSALADLPLRGSFTMASTPGARQVTVSAPSAMQAGKTATVRVTLSAAGDTTLDHVRLALQLPQGWKVVPAGPTVFNHVGPSTAPTATFLVTPPSYAPNASAVVHATATMGDLQREAGVSTTVSG
jgi:beta-glucosidase